MSDPIVELVADVLHRVARGPHSLVDVEDLCYCRRVGTVDGTLNGSLEASFTEEWGFTDPPICPLTASDFVIALRERGVVLVSAESLAAALREQMDSYADGQLSGSPEEIAAAILAVPPDTHAATHGAANGAIPDVTTAGQT